jgi:replication-associated recombination protein RarA
MSESKQPWMLGDYDGYEVLSALRKSIKLGDVEQALYWLNVVLEFGGNAAQATVARQLWVVAAEDCDDPMVVLRAHAVFAMAGRVSETDHLMFLTAQMCRARKWWSTPEGRATDRAWSKAVGDLRDPERRREIPVWALDRHTRGGWERHRAGLAMDDRFSGTDRGRAKTSYLFQRDGRLDPAADIDAGFWPVWREREALEATHLEGES